MRVVGIFLLGALMFNASAASGSCNNANRSVNLLTLLGNSASGAYDDCLKSLRQVLLNLQQQQRLYEFEAQMLEDEAQRLSGERQAAANRLAAMNRRQATAAKALTEAEGGRGVSEAELKSLLEREDKLREELEQLSESGGATAQQEVEIKRRQEALVEQIDDFLDDE
ncbi:MAG: hypothetical protein P8Q48_20260 [Paracoccaceae bacterium]|nr:hypothetical protein [Paracoccaceae bacterium]MDG1207622.1 hypothetical protein [Paracoccaceae bacterium]MDG1372532.1 hypothetical protein [Paracoccaceae bacterium]